MAALLSPSTSLLGPVIGLNAWTFVMEGWMYYERLSWITNSKFQFRPELTKDDFDKKQPPSVRFKADNFNHLFEQPTQFYAVALTMAMMGVNSKLDVRLAWTYVAGRIVHSFVQSLGNHVPTRFGLFLMNSTILAVMTARAAIGLMSKA